MKVLLQNINNTGDIIDALIKLPRDTQITPFGDENTTLVYDEKNKRLYMDNATFLDEEFGIYDN